jgi:hypothetical protein
MAIGRINFVGSLTTHTQLLLCFYRFYGAYQKALAGAFQQRKPCLALNFAGEQSLDEL